jgi:alkylation response protein AidB-like acyl-CoA dehydrogenase
MPSSALLTTLLAHLRALDGVEPGAALRSLVEASLDRIPLPGQGATLERWRLLAAVGAHDLALAKLFEGHTDALAILHEAGTRAGTGPASPYAPPEGALWGTWCAEPPDARLRLDTHADGSITLRGRKSWCSGAAHLTHALVSCWNVNGEAMLAAVDLRQNGVGITDDGWEAVGMRGSGSVDVYFERAVATPIGGPDFYVSRPGFWHGGAGVAACWFGAASFLAQYLAEQLRARMADKPDPHRLAQLGEVAVALQATAALMRETAAAIDGAPEANAMHPALSLRLSVEDTATKTLGAVGRALGAGPLCKDAAIARLVADLPVFMRQSHAERDQEALGRLLAEDRRAPWKL